MPTNFQKQQAREWQLRWEKVAFMRDAQKMTFEAIAKAEGITRARAHQLYKKAKRGERQASHNGAL